MVTRGLKASGEMNVKETEIDIFVEEFSSEIDRFKDSTEPVLLNLFSKEETLIGLAWLAL